MIAKTCLYRHFDERNTLLYVGISLNAVKRLAEHRNMSKWFYDISRVEFTWFDTREEALIAERHAVTNESPIYNKNLRAGVKKVIEEKTAEKREEHRNAITYKVVVLNPVYTINDAARVLNISDAALRQKIEKNEIGAMLLNQNSHTKKNGQEVKSTRYQISGWQLFDYIQYLESKREQP